MRSQGKFQANGKIIAPPVGQGNYSGPVSALCEGTVTAYFVWVTDPNDPTDAPPDTAYVQWDATGSWQAVNEKDEVVAENGFGGDYKDTSYPPTMSATCSTLGYIAVTSPGTSFSVTCADPANPSAPPLKAKATGHPTVMGTDVSVRATVKVKVAIQYFKMKFNGATLQNNKPTYLVGQGISPFIDTSRASSSVQSITGNTWSMTGGNCFKSFSSGNSSGLTLMYAPDWVTASPTFYCADKAVRSMKVSFTVNFKTQNPNVSKSYPASISASFEVIKPDLPGNFATSGQVGISSRVFNNGALSGVITYNLYTNRDPNFPNGYGFAVTTWVATPSAFNRGNEVGRWHYTQLALMGRHAYDNSSPPLSFHPSIIRKDLNKTNCLDGYFAGATADPFDSPQGDGWLANKTQRLWLDAPSEPMDGYSRQVVMNESFDNYVMYLPPVNGVGSMWVPISMCTWRWSADSSSASILDMTYFNYQLTDTHPSWSMTLPVPLVFNWVRD